MLVDEFAHGHGGVTNAHLSFTCMMHPGTIDPRELNVAMRYRTHALEYISILITSN